MPRSTAATVFGRVIVASFASCDSDAPGSVQNRACESISPRLTKPLEPGEIKVRICHKKAGDVFSRSESQKSSEVVTIQGVEDKRADEPSLLENAACVPKVLGERDALSNGADPKIRIPSPECLAGADGCRAGRRRLGCLEQRQRKVRSLIEMGRMDEDP